MKTQIILEIIKPCCTDRFPNEDKNALGTLALYLLPCRGNILQQEITVKL